jgi:hypothetical protein
MRERLLRFLSPSERTWLVTGTLGSAFVITLVIEGTGAIPQGIQTAIAQAASVNAGATAILRGGLRRYRWARGEKAPVVRHVPEPPRPGMLDGTRLLDEAPGFEVSVAPRPAIIFRVHHALMDGRGLLHFVQDVFRALRGELPFGGDDHLTDTLLAASLLGEKAHASSRRATRRRFIAATGRHEGSILPMWGRRRINGVWHDLLPRVAAGVLAYARRADAAAPARLHIPVDLRRYAKRRSTSNLTGIISLDPEVGAGAADIASALRRGLANDEALHWVSSLNVLNRIPLWLLRRAGKMKMTRAIRTSHFNATAILSNLGRIALEAFRAPGFEPRQVYWLPPCGPATAAALGIIGDAQGVDVTAVLPSGLASEGRLDQLLDAVIHELNAGRD